MEIRKTVTCVEEINSEYGTRANPALRRVAIAAVFKNPLAGKMTGADLQPLIDYSLELGVSLTKTALAALGSEPSQLRSYTKAALVGSIPVTAWPCAALSSEAASSFRVTPRLGRPDPRSTCSMGHSTWGGTSTRSTPRPF